MDEWDSIVNLEEEAFKKGLTEGNKDADHSYFSEGFENGMSNGFYFGITLSIIQRECQSFIDKNDDKTNKTYERCIELIERISCFPTNVISSYIILSLKYLIYIFI